ncbi:von Willebrand factor A domain-containing protein 7-like [Haliotis asinina]|uniref:von Willebrand factor A domain-containing protein 7-like n=1 Tax=Haliotis asinina TaxID=109174 RepID=UPI0035327ED4
MPSKILTILCFVLLCTVCVLGFLPNRFSHLSSDFTHQDITESAILRTVVEMFEETPLWRKSSGSGTHITMKEITTKALFDAYNVGTVSEKRFQEAIDDIVKANNRVDLDHYTEAAWHVNGEAIKEANDKITSLRAKTIFILNQTRPDYSAARDLIGQFLHIVQMFYSNTNWPELSGSAVYDSLGIPGKQLLAVAPSSADTCKSCRVSPGINCTDNMLDLGAVLTSGYRSGQDRVKPFKEPQTHQTGKCSHGGPNDTSSTTSAATGGINKDSNNPSLSPHYYLHQQAAEGAIRHTKFFLDDRVYGLRHLVGDDKFQKLLQVKVDNSMVFVIDTSSLSKKNMATLKAFAAVIMEETSSKITNDQTEYLIMTAGGPGSVQRVYRSRNAEEAQHYIDALPVNEGTTCQQFSLHNVEAAASLAHPDSEIYVLTNGPPADIDRAIDIIRIVTEKRIRLHFLTGYCGHRRGRERRHGEPRRRRSAGMDLYSGLATASGGSTYITDKGGVAKMADIIKESATTSGTTILKMSVDAAAKKTIDIPIDNTIRDVTIKIISDAGTRGEPVNTLSDPHNTSVAMATSGNVTLKDLGGGVRLIKIKSPQPGVWHLTKKDSYHWDLEVTAQSTIDFSTKFVQTNPMNGFQYEITGRPIAGDKATAIITVPSIDKIGAITKVVLTDSKGAELESSALTQGSGRASSIFRGTFTLPTKAFQVTIRGKDKSGNALQRLEPTKITPIAVKLKIGTLTGSLYINEDLKIPYTVTNTGDSKTTIAVDITDDQGFAVSPLKKSFTLEGNSSATGSFALHAGSTAGITTTVTVSAQPTGISGHSPQFDTRRITVEEHIVRKVDNTTPECNVTSVIGSCSMAQMDPCSCHMHTWSGTAVFGDVGFGLFQISSTVGTSGSFTYDNFTMGHTIDKGAKTAKIGSDCCHPVSYINVVDMASNTAQCKFDLAPGLTKPVYDCMTTPTTAANTSFSMEPDADTSGLSPGAIAGIAVAAAAVLAATIVTAVLIGKKSPCVSKGQGKVETSQPPLAHTR